MTSRCPLKCSPLLSHYMSYQVGGSSERDLFGEEDTEGDAKGAFLGYRTLCPPRRAIGEKQIACKLISRVGFSICDQFMISIHQFTILACRVTYHFGFYICDQFLPSIHQFTVLACRVIYHFGFYIFDQFMISIYDINMISLYGITPNTNVLCCDCPIPQGVSGRSCSVRGLVSVAILAQETELTRRSVLGCGGQRKVHGRCCSRRAAGSRCSIHLRRAGCSDLP